MADEAPAGGRKRRKAGLRVPSDSVPRQPALATIEEHPEIDLDDAPTIPMDEDSDDEFSSRSADDKTVEMDSEAESNEDEGVDIAFDEDELTPPPEAQHSATVELSHADWETVDETATAKRPQKRKPPPAPAKPIPNGLARPSSRRAGKPWHEEIFDENYLKTLPFLTPQATQAEAKFVLDSLGIRPGGQVLDVGCGYGRHAMEFAAHGFHVVGVDSSLPMLLRGADESQRRGLTINFVHGDMRELDLDTQFDGAYCLFSTFGYFDDDENKRAAKNIARALKPGMRCVFEVLNRDYLVRDLPTRVWWEGDGCVVLEEVEFNYFTSRVVSKRSIVFEDARQIEQEITMRSYSLHELGKLLHSVGFRVVEISGSMATRGRFFGAHSRDLIMVVERRDSPSALAQG